MSTLKPGSGVIAVIVQVLLVSCSCLSCSAVSGFDTWLPWYTYSHRHSDLVYSGLVECVHWTLVTDDGKQIFSAKAYHPVITLP